MITFFHTADVHFGVENYGGVDSKTGVNSRFLDFVHSFECCVLQAIEQDVDFFLFCGDAYKTAYPTPTQQKQFVRLLCRLQQANIPVVIVVGNHDHPLSFGKANALDLFSTIPLPGMHVFSKPDVLELETKSGKVQIVGIPWPMRHNLVAKSEHRFKDSGEITQYISQKVGSIIESFAQKLNPDIPSILAGHLTVSNGLFSGSEKCAVFGNDPIFLPSQLAIKPFDYVALGHLHRYQNLNPKGYPAIVYSGSIERIDFGERKEKKGYCKVCIDETQKENRCHHEFIEVPTRPMIQVEVFLEAGKNQTEQILHALKGHTLDKSIIKIMYHIPKDESDTVDLLALQRACSSAFYIASITGIRKPVAREQRIKLTVAMDFASVLKKYFEGNGEQLKTDRGINLKNLEKKAFKIYQDLQDDELEKDVRDKKQEEMVSGKI